MLRQMGFGVGIDQFSLNDTSLNLLKEIKPAYVKIEKDYFQEIDSSLGNTEVALNSLLSLTDSLDTKLIVTKIEDEEMHRTLLSKRIAYFQGLAIAPITPLE
jgi:EAL domain-containing protein (putative c-di-GMP-specific phosphodiesterase class I)